MKLGLFCFKGSGCAFLIYPAQARIFHSDSPCVLLLGFCTSHRGRVRVQSNCNRPGRIARCFFAKTCERPRMRLFASHRYFNQLSKNDPASKERLSTPLAFSVDRPQHFGGPTLLTWSIEFVTSQGTFLLRPRRVPRPLQCPITAALLV